MLARIVHFRLQQSQCRRFAGACLMPPFDHYEVYRISYKINMDFESLRKYFLDKPGATEDFPFGPSAMVFKVRSKMFALIAVEETPLRINLKCDPELARHLRAAYDAVQPGYHMNKKHWNTVLIDGSHASRASSWITRRG